MVLTLFFFTENDESTRAFAESYNMTLKDDDAEFLYLDKEGSGMPNDQMLVDGEGGSDVEEDEDNEPETVTHDEISRRVRQMQEEGVSFVLFLSSIFDFFSNFITYRCRWF